MTENRLDEELRRAPQGTKEALEAFRATGDLKQLEFFAKGVVARNIDDNYIDLLEKPDDSIHIIDDLGIDSLTMVEIAITFEDALEIELIDDELKELQTLADIRQYLIKKIESKAV